MVCIILNLGRGVTEQELSKGCKVVAKTAIEELDIKEGDCGEVSEVTPQPNPEGNLARPHLVVLLPQTGYCEMAANTRRFICFVFR